VVTMSIKLELLSEQYQLGHQLIDGQHEILFQLFRELSEYCENENYNLEVELILQSLKTYIETHFRFEEDLMESLNYQYLTEHKSEHRNLEQQVIDEIDRFASITNKDEIKEFALEIKGFLFGWLVHHIAETDKKLCQTLT
jgi:hemerythrin